MTDAFLVRQVSQLWTCFFFTQTFSKSGFWSCVIKRERLRSYRLGNIYHYIQSISWKWSNKQFPISNKPFFFVHTKAPVSKYSIHTLLAVSTICIQSATILFADLTIHKAAHSFSSRTHRHADYPGWRVTTVKTILILISNRLHYGQWGKWRGNKNGR